MADPFPDRSSVVYDTAFSPDFIPGTDPLFIRIAQPSQSASMLRYVNRGHRDYGSPAAYTVKRDSWEFQAIVGGCGGPVLSPPDRSPMRRRTLWVLPPECAHGWRSLPNEGCEITVFQFPEAPEPVASMARRTGYLTIPLTVADARRLRELAALGHACMAAPDDQCHLHEQRILIELCLLVLRGVPARPLSPGERNAESICDRALAWYASRMREGPTAAGMARAVHVSPAHLRRLFHQCKGISPQAALRRLRIRQAEDLLIAGLGQGAIAAACGFAGPAALSRAFSAVHGRPPGAWLRSLPSRGAAGKQIRAG